MKAERHTTSVVYYRYRPWIQGVSGTYRESSSTPMACRKRRHLLGLFLFYFLISHLPVLFCIYLMLSKLSLELSCWPEGRPVVTDVSPLSGISGLPFDSIFLSAVLLLCLVLLPLLSCRFSPFGPVPCLLFRNVFNLSQG